MKKHAKSSRHYSAQTLKILWGRAAGRCAVPECRIELVVDPKGHDPMVVIGDIAHIEASSDSGPRANRDLSGKGRDSYENLILLCKNCHARLDGQKETNSDVAIRKLRADHEAWVRASLPERGRTTSGWKVLVLQGDHPVDAARAVAALSPDYVKGRPAILAVSPDQPWSKSLGRMSMAVQRFLKGGDPFDRRFAVFPLAPVSACLAVGYLLTNRPRVRLFQHHRTVGSWAWPKQKAPPSDLKVSGLPGTRDKVSGDVVICFHLSATIQRADIPVPKQLRLRIIDIAVPKPSVHWLRSATQLDALGDAATEVFSTLLRQMPNATCWHLLFAGPAPGAVRVGQQLNPTMSPLAQLYEFNRAASPCYTPSMLLPPQST